MKYTDQHLVFKLCSSSDRFGHAFFDEAKRLVQAAVSFHRAFFHRIEASIFAPGVEFAPYLKLHSMSMLSLSRRINIIST